MHAYAYPAPILSGRAALLATAAGIHVLLLWAIASGLTQRIIERVAPVTPAKLIEPEEKTPPPPPRTDPELRPYELDLTPPDVTIPPPPAAQRPMSTEVPAWTAPAARPTPPARIVQRVSPQLDLARSPPTDDYYPPTERRLGHEGTVTVDACVGTDGRAARAQIEASSGYPRLDQAALRWAQRARWRVGAEDGRPVETCGYRFNVVFRLVDGGRR